MQCMTTLGTIIGPALFEVLLLIINDIQLFIHVHTDGSSGSSCMS